MVVESIKFLKGNSLKKVGKCKSLSFDVISRFRHHDTDDSAPSGM
jgi:hypothetical protein